MIGARIKLWLAAAGAFIVAVTLAFWRGSRAGKEELRNEQAGDTLDRIDAGREAVIDGRNSGGSPDDRLRQNDGRWM